MRKHRFCYAGALGLALAVAVPATAMASGIQNNVSTPTILAKDSVKWTGEGVAAVVAETEAQAQDRWSSSRSTGSPCPPSWTPREPPRMAPPRSRPRPHDKLRLLRRLT